jgi:SSS family solute:Na+ symporter
LTTPDYLIILLYGLVLLAFTLRTFSSKWKNVFGSGQKPHWLLGGLSLFMMTLTVDVGQLYTGIIQGKGIWGLWLLWNSYLIIGVVPIIFAPLWARLGFITDNQFILFRFSGLGAKVLYRFRAIYVGGLVVSFLLSFQLLAFQRILSKFLDINSESALLLAGLLLVLFAIKNSFTHKLKMDALHAIIYFLGMVVAAYFLIHQQGGWASILHTAKESIPEKLLLLPDWSNETFTRDFVMYVTVLWWSASLFDGGGQEAQRFFSLREGRSAVKAALSSLIFKQGAILLLIMTIIAGMVLNPISAQSSEASFVGYFTGLPAGLKGLSFVAFFAAFITTCESQLNWGSSYLVVDLYKDRFPDKKNRHYTRVSFFTMILMAILALLIARFNQSLHSLIQFFFSISAGVAPVFILRWVWMRINAWSQLSAMIASLIYSFTFNYLVDFYQYELQDLYTLRILTVTSLTTLTWLLVTFLTPRDDEKTLTLFREKIPLSAFSTKRILLGFAVGISYTLVLLGLIKLLLIN